MLLKNKIIKLYNLSEGFTHQVLQSPLSNIFTLAYPPTDRTSVNRMIKEHVQY